MQEARWRSESIIITTPYFPGIIVIVQDKTPKWLFQKTHNHTGHPAAELTKFSGTLNKCILWIFKWLGWFDFLHWQWTSERSCVIWRDQISVEPTKFLIRRHLQLCQSNRKSSWSKMSGDLDMYTQNTVKGTKMFVGGIIFAVSLKVDNTCDDQQQLPYWVNAVSFHIFAVTLLDVMAQKFRRFREVGT